MSSKLSEKELLEEAKAVTRDWKKLGLLLGFSWNDLTRIQVDKARDGLQSTVFTMLYHWSTSNSFSSKKEQKARLAEAQKLALSK